ncbi:hypothetical protein GGF44_000266 [Coemansia sp. RSA 1694]|nr:hypothetical protein IWW47_004860 [Coemansia sp. RSA 2052]KAJ2644987.1 hypothetical protein GGF44_000266 [Coemansia sp. RSA 1694]
MNTVYNLLNELGDLNRSNRRTAQVLAEQFSVLQAQVTTNTSTTAAPPFSEGDDEDEEGEDGATFHTPPSVSRTVGGSGGVGGDRRISSSAVQTDLDFASMQQTSEHVRRIEAENAVLRQDVRVLIGALKEHQDMGKEYEATLARALVALRSAAFERHLEISDVQTRYREILAAEQTLNGRLQNENIELRAALSSTAQAIRTTLNEQQQQQQQKVKGE